MGAGRDVDLRCTDLRNETYVSHIECVHDIVLRGFRANGVKKTTEASRGKNVSKYSVRESNPALARVKRLY